MSEPPPSSDIPNVLTLEPGPVAPVGPVSPCGPVGPISPVAPVGPISPCGPVDPVAPVSPVGPGTKDSRPIQAFPFHSQTSPFGLVYVSPINEGIGQFIILYCYGYFYKYPAIKDKYLFFLS
jgi:hypothetical protein